MFQGERERCLIQPLEARRLMSVSVAHTAASGGGIAPGIVVQPLFTPTLGIYAGDLLSGSQFDGFVVTGNFKLTLNSYNASTGVLSGVYHTENLLADGKTVPSLAIAFHADAHLTAAGGFDLHIEGKLGNVKLKGDYKRDDTYISGNLTGTVIGSTGKSYDFSFLFDLSKRS
jgi:hypothetical protein